MEAPTSEPTPQGSSGRNLRVAIASGVALAATFIATILLHPLAFLGFIAVLAIVGLLELDVAFREQGWRPATPVAVSAGLVMLFGTYFSGASAQSLGLVLLVVGALAWMLLDGSPHGVIASFGVTLLMALWVPFLVSFIGLLLVRDDGTWIILAVVALSVTNDIGAYAFGSHFGRRKLAPSVSPGKSWEGFAGGMATTLLIAAGVTGPFVPGLDTATAIGLATAVVVASTIGDLAESLIKRDLGIKDLGRIIPGHGGIMDRADSVIFALPAAHLLLLVLGL
ncbi:MAG TPA: phosphatidate cytidylyltransferase [Egibacteraceae bacterium]|nr:phosphatidate cytidylyltransferase [Egibacteraceae bacterium]